MKIDVELENCYGINKLKYSFNFSNKKTYAIYASNGTMKTSFSKTFDDLQQGKDSRDEIYESKDSIRKIIKNEQDLTSEEVFVIKPYQEKYQSSEIAKLLVNEELKRQYNNEYASLKTKKEEFLKLLKNLSGISSLNEIEREVCNVFFQGVKDKFLLALQTVKVVLDEENECSLYSGVRYSEIFNKDTIDILKDENFLKNIQTYIKKYEELLENSTFFKKGIFNHIQAGKIATELEKNGFFKAMHSILNSQGEKIKTKKELESLIESEKDQILSDEDLKRKFKTLDDQLKKKQSLQKFRDYLANNVQIITELENPTAFKAKLWKCYFKEEITQFNDLLDKFDESKNNLSSIRKIAKKERGHWDRVIEEFNNKFFVPFELYVENKIDSILNDATPQIGFKFDDLSVEEDKLLLVLSQGEKRALYILNILFEVEVKKKGEQNCLFIIDDIADSFDYKNKYAIIEYLKEISDHDNFCSIILTHNFDFYRSIL